ncbi:MAG: FUSC family protein, partial [Pseudonocardiales bacterium]|nr:FUSC family protein [Pseudonocardiales bacterium]
MAAPLAWLKRHDPGLVIVKRAARTTLVACLGFYLCRYVLVNIAMAPYALFGVVALGALSQIPGSPAQRARTLLAVLPVGWVLVTLGTLLSVSTVTAVAGMFVLGFAVSFAG